MSLSCHALTKSLSCRLQGSIKRLKSALHVEFAITYLHLTTLVCFLFMKRRSELSPYLATYLCGFLKQNKVWDKLGVSCLNWLVLHSVCLPSLSNFEQRPVRSRLYRRRGSLEKSQAMTKKMEDREAMFISSLLSHSTFLMVRLGLIGMMLIVSSLTPFKTRKLRQKKTLFQKVSLTQ